MLTIIEDVHWSDDASMEFLLHLARRVATLPVLLLMTYRSEELNEGLRHFLAELDRARLARELTLGSLTIEETGEMLQAIFSLERRVTRDLLQTIHSLTNGNTSSSRRSSSRW